VPKTACVIRCLGLMLDLASYHQTKTDPAEMRGIVSAMGKVAWAIIRSVSRSAHLLVGEYPGNCEREETPGRYGMICQK
jgi:hypothetical protein